MYIEQLAMKIDKKLCIYFNNKTQNYIAGFSGAEEKNGILLVSIFGTGKDANEAVNDYAKRISGKSLFFGAYTNSRVCYNIPELDIAYPETWEYND